jgi:hypothetical protein
VPLTLDFSGLPAGPRINCARYGGFWAGLLEYHHNGKSAGRDYAYCSKRYRIASTKGIIDEANKSTLRIQA